MPSRFQRRDFLIASAAVSLNSIACVKPRPHTHATVSITRCREYSNELYGKVLDIVRTHGLAVKGKRVVLKPNLVEFDPGRAINTHPALVHAAFEAFRSLGAAEVRVAEGPGHRRITLDLADAAGYFGRFADFERSFTDLNLDEVTKVSLRHPVSKLNSLYLPNTALHCDLLVSLPKMKTHHWVGATLSMKNLFGLVPGGVYGWPKNVLHWAGIHECIADLNAMFPNTFAIVDGIDAMEGNGPIQGTMKHAGVLVAGKSLPAVDATCCRIMGIDPGKIEYLRLVSNFSAASSDDIRYSGETVAAVATNFELLPNFQNIRLYERPAS
jgi:uncharacterized protein (DUF362 family)